MVQEISELAVVDMKRTLLAAHTRTGIRRQKLTGGEPGRYRAGDPVHMIDKITTEPAWLDENTVQGSWGWLNGDVQAYFLEQDGGEEKIPAAHSMFNSFMRARILFQKEVNNLPKLLKAKYEV